MRKTLFLLFGAPGSGKGYLGDRIKQELINSGKVTSLEDIAYISTGDLLRAEIASGSDFGKELSGIVSSGGLVSDEIVNQLVRKALIADKQFFMLDGYPRTQEQLYEFWFMVPQNMEVIAIKVITPTELILERVSKRRVCKSCKHTHTVSDGCCPKCGGESIIRNDDANIKNRLAVYEAHTHELWNELYDRSDDAYSIDGREDTTPAAELIVSNL